jgi:hypothetical protein
MILVFFLYLHFWGWIKKNNRKKEEEKTHVLERQTEREIYREREILERGRERERERVLTPTVQYWMAGVWEKERYWEWEVGIGER